MSQTPQRSARFAWRRSKRKARRHAASSSSLLDRAAQRAKEQSFELARRSAQILAGLRRTRCGDAHRARWALTPAGLRRLHAAGSRVRRRDRMAPSAPVADQSTGLPLLQLPAGFQYASFAWSGDTMLDGRPCPDRHDGMAVVMTRQTSARRRACADTQSRTRLRLGIVDDRRQQDTTTVERSMAAAHSAARRIWFFAMAAGSRSSQASEAR